MRGRRGLLAPLALALLASWLAACEPPKPLLVVSVYEWGLARVDCYVPVGGNMSVAIPLLGRPDPALGVVVVDEWGEPLAYAINETLRALIVACLNASVVHVSYYVQDITSKVGATWIVNFTSPYRVRVVLPANATVTGLERLPVSVYGRDSHLVMEFEPGPVLVKYVILYAPAQPPANRTAPGRQQAQPQAQQPSVQQPPPPWSGILQPPIVYALVIALAAAAATVALAARRGRSVSALTELSEEDLAILDALKKAGGGAFQSDLQKMVGMPPTTLWRRVRRLEKLGYLKVEKRAGRNFVRLA